MEPLNVEHLSGLLAQLTDEPPRDVVPFPLPPSFPSPFSPTLPPRPPGGRRQVRAVPRAGRAPQGLRPGDQGGLQGEGEGVAPGQERDARRHRHVS